MEKARDEAISSKSTIMGNLVKVESTKKTTDEEPVSLRQKNTDLVAKLNRAWELDPESDEAIETLGSSQRR